VWSIVGEVDVVVVAPGKIVPDGRVKSVQSLDAGVVASVSVREGQPVAEGDTLVTLESQLIRADLHRMTAEHLSAGFDHARVSALLGGLETIQPPSVSVEEALVSARAQAQTLRLTQQLVLHRATLGAFHAESNRARAEAETIRVRLREYDEVAPLIEEQVAAIQQLVSRDLAPRDHWIALERERLTYAATRTAARSELTATAATVAGIEERLVQYRSEFRAELMSEQAQLVLRMAGLVQEIAKLNIRLERTRLRAPVAGMVHQLSVHGPGAVVTPAQVLMTIVPARSQLVAEAWVPNKDSGFVENDALVEVKVDAFPFTRYGTIAGTVLTISGDAIANEQLGLVFAAQVKLHESAIEVGDRRVQLTPGMSVTVEVKTGRRRIIEFLLSPVIRALRESARER
jgi:hemolysin D